MSCHATAPQSGGMAVCGLCGSEAAGGAGGGLLVLPQKRCGDKLKVTFGSKKKHRAGPILSLLESAECSMLSVEQSATTSVKDVRYLLLAKHEGTFTRFRLHAKFVQYAPLAVGDEVMFNFPNEAIVPPDMQPVITPNTIAVIQETHCHGTDEALSQYVVNVCLQGPEMYIASFTVLRCHLYYIKRCADLIMHAA
jgi:hypothetical protein